MFYLWYQHTDKLPVLLAAENIPGMGGGSETYQRTVFGHKEVRDGYSPCTGSWTSASQSNQRCSP